MKFRQRLACFFGRHDHTHLLWAIGHGATKLPDTYPCYRCNKLLKS